VTKGRIVPERAPVETSTDVHADGGHAHWLWCRMAGEKILDEMPQTTCVVLTRGLEWQLHIKNGRHLVACFDSGGDIELGPGIGTVNLHYLEQGPWMVADSIVQAWDVAADVVVANDREPAQPTRLSVSEPSPLHDVGRWSEPIPESAPTSICLPAWGGRVIVRGYETTSSAFAPMATSTRWIVETTMVPLDDRPDIEGPGGPVYPGDCIVYFGTGTSIDEDEPELWHPQRVLKVDALPQGWQRVWTLSDATTRDEPSYLHHSELPQEIFVGTALHGNWRDFILDAFQLAIECTECGGYGKSIVYGSLDDEMTELSPHVIAGGNEVSAIDAAYQCTCGASWRISAEGHRTVTYL